MAIRVTRSSEKSRTFGATVTPRASGKTIYFGWLAGGLYRQPYWQVTIEPDSFETVFAAMLDADYEGTVLAFANALTKREPKRKDCC